MNSWLLILGVAILSYCLTAVLRRYALSQKLMDLPNERSSHTVATPRGGGVAIVVAFLLAIPFLWMWGLLPFSFLLALIGSAGGIAVIGFMDDHGHIAARWRLLGHFSAAAWALYWIGGIPSLVFFEWRINENWIGVVLGAFYLVWMLNLYNFMDGIDGIASLEASSVCIAVVILYWTCGYESLVWPPLILVAAVIGFFYWNFPPARIFMGDAGSGFLGIVLAILSLQAASVSPVWFWVWLILLGVFIVDATVTLLRRLLRGDRVYEAHRSHAYQFASRRVGKHLPVTLAVGAINLFWLLPIAACVALLGLDGLLGVFFAYVPLLFLAVKLQAGEREHP